MAAMVASAPPDHRVDWANQMRKLVLFVTEKKWGDEQHELLYKGIDEYGIGEWGKICDALLPKVRHNLAVSFLGSMCFSETTTC
eukprot:6349836-Pyramimonas_sp.AAC.1